MADIGAAARRISGFPARPQPGSSCTARRAADGLCPNVCKKALELGQLKVNRVLNERGRGEATPLRHLKDVALI
jgi:hypothetical protein